MVQTYRTKGLIMRIAVLTLRLHTNYGGILQAYALMTVLKRLGHEPILINNQPFKYRSGISKCAEYIKYCINSIQKFILGKRTLEIFYEKRIRKEYETVYRNARRFTELYIQPHTDIVCTVKEWSQLQSQYQFDAYIVGSDQVWRPLYAKPISRYFFSFLKEQSVKRIAYAASFGVDTWTFSLKETAQCRSLLAKFDAISVREESGVQLCENYLGQHAIHVLDPTMLLNANDYRVLLPQINHQGEIFSYILDPTNWKSMFQHQFSESLRLQLFDVNGLLDSSPSRIEGVPDRTAPVENWLNGFASAKYIITDSFHACVFSILFHVPFWVCSNEQRGLSRIKSLLELFGLEERLVQSDFKLDQLVHATEIDWEHVDAILDQWRKDSIYFLNQNL